jgi:Icc-related predicted phosphoesterase
MRIHLFSDLHLEFGKMAFPPEVRAGTLAELVLLAGDIDTRRRAPIWAAQTFSRRLEPQDQLRLHEVSRIFLEDELGKHFDGITIVMTHHAPSLRSLPPGHRRDPLTPAYASDLEHLIERFRPALWVHGHVHSSSDYVIGGTRVICNPRGYADEPNASFDPQLVIEIG